MRCTQGIIDFKNKKVISGLYFGIYHFFLSLPIYITISKYVEIILDRLKNSVSRLLDMYIHSERLIGW